MPTTAQEHAAAADLAIREMTPGLKSVAVDGMAAGLDIDAADAYRQKQLRRANAADGTRPRSAAVRLTAF